LTTGVRFAGREEASKDWRLGIGENFGVTSNGDVYCNNIIIASGKLGGMPFTVGTTTDNRTQVEFNYNANHTFTITATNIRYTTTDGVTSMSGNSLYFANRDASRACILSVEEGENGYDNKVSVLTGANFRSKDGVNASFYIGSTRYIFKGGILVRVD
jgi:hypothetical protein